MTLRKTETAVPSTSGDNLITGHRVEAPRISRQSTYEGGKVVSLTQRLPLPSRR